MCIYGIELLEDNVLECRNNLLNIFTEQLKIDRESVWNRAVFVVLKAIIIHGDAFTLKTPDGEPIQFLEWGLLGGGKFQRRDFRYDSLTQRSSIEGSLFAFLEGHEFFMPTKSYVPMTVQVVAR